MFLAEFETAIRASERP